MSQDSYIGHRFEFKYALTPRKAALVEDYLEQLCLEKDLFAPNQFYTVNSLYFETPMLDDYLDKEAALLKRRKLRARIYEPTFEGYSGDVWLEIKKKYDMRISKERSRISNSIWNDILDGSISDLVHTAATKESISDPMVFRNFVRRYADNSYRPKIQIRYKRKPYLTSFVSKVRLTLDKEIEAAAWNSGVGNSFFPVALNTTVLEVKFNYALPWWFKEMIEKFELSRTDFSKYNHSIDTVFRKYGALSGR